MNAKIVTVLGIPAILILLSYPIITSNLTFAANNNDQQSGQLVITSSGKMTNGDRIGNASVTILGLPGAVFFPANHQ